MINVGVFVWLDLAVRHSGAGGDGDVGHDLLLGREGDPAPASVLPHRGGICGIAREFRQIDGILKAAHAAAAEKAVDHDLPGLTPQRMSMLDLADPLELPKMRIEIRAVRHHGEVEQATAQGPVALVLGGLCDPALLAHERGLPVQGEPAQVQCRYALGEDLRIDATVLAKTVIEAETDALDARCVWRRFSRGV